MNKRLEDLNKNSKSAFTDPRKVQPVFYQVQANKENKESKDYKDEYKEYWKNKPIVNKNGKE